MYLLTRTGYDYKKKTFTDNDKTNEQNKTQSPWHILLNNRISLDKNITYHRHLKKNVSPIHEKSMTLSPVQWTFIRLELLCLESSDLRRLLRHCCPSQPPATIKKQHGHYKYWWNEHMHVKNTNHLWHRFKLPKAVKWPLSFLHVETVINHVTMSVRYTCQQCLQSSVPICVGRKTFY